MRLVGDFFHFNLTYYLLSQRFLALFPIDRA
jgi:hypothetical protein